MVTAVPKTNFTFDEYLAYDDGTDNRYELQDGELILMNPPTYRHALIIRFLNNSFEAEISRLDLPWAALQMLGVRTAPRRSRLPDLCVVPIAEALEKLDVSAVLESGALLVVEVVSPDSVRRDYRFKRAEYASFGIPEYWIVDPVAQTVTLLLLVEGLYEETVYRGEETIQSPLFPDLVFTVNQILQL